MVQPVLLMKEKLATFAAFYDMLLVCLMSMIDHLVITGKSLATSLAISLLAVKKPHDK